MSEEEINEMALLKVIPLISLGGKDRNFNDRLFYTQGAKDCNQKWEEKLRWIPVEEKLPEIDESLSKSELHYSISVEVMNGVKIQSAYFNTETGKWRSLITGYIINPTHWRRFL